MRIVVYCLIAVVAACSATQALAHGYIIKLVNNKITVQQSLDPILNPATLQTFDTGFMATNAVTAGTVTQTGPTTLLTNHGSIDGYENNVLDPLTGTQVTTQPGLTIHNPANVVDDVFHFDVLTPLMYSNGGSATTAPNGIYMQIQKVGPSPVNVTALSGFQSGFDLIGRSAHETNKYLLDWDGTAGAYAYAFQVSGHTSANVPFVTSDPMVFAMATPGFETDPNFQQAVYNAYSGSLAQLPEPSTLVLGVCGCLCGGLMVVHRRRTSRQA